MGSSVRVETGSSNNAAQEEQVVGSRDKKIKKGFTVRQKPGGGSDCGNGNVWCRRADAEAGGATGVRAGEVILPRTTCFGLGSAAGGLRLTETTKRCIAITDV